MQDQNGSEEENIDWTTDDEEEILGETGSSSHPTLTVRNEASVGNGEVGTSSHPTLTVRSEATVGNWEVKLYAVGLYWWL